jgi:carboxymethylenebutenolidase
MAWQLVQVGEQRLAAIVPFYGPAPESPDFSRSEAAVLGVYAGEDERVNASRGRATAALERAGLVHEIRTFEGAGHAFFNDTGPRYDAAAAADAWAALLAWFGRHLA